MSSKPIRILIMGRPNVGKSTLFNRLLEERKAIVDDMSGVTRDRQYGVTEWAGKSFNVIDTGGFVPDSRDMFETANKMSNEYFTTIYELNIKFAQDAWNLWSKKNDEVSKD